MSRSLPQWLHYLETLNPHKIVLGLERVAQAAAKLGLTQFACPVITVTGTNGKGSCVSLLESCFRAGNYRVGAYTSPHLFRFNERVRINGVDIDDQALCEAFTSVAAATENPEVTLTYFEFTTLAALWIFQQSRLDALILEVGLGGRLDAVNIVDADVAVITTIDIDHTDWLGNSRESIGREKAGILRAGRAAVCGDFHPPNSVIATARQLNAKLYCIGKDFHYEATTSDWCWQTDDCACTALPLPRLKLQNAATALMAIQLLQPKLPLSKNSIATGLRQASLPGRFQQVALPKPCIFDVAHNPQAAAWLAQQLENAPCQGKTLAVAGMLADKDIANTLGALRTQVDAWYVGSLPGPRGASQEVIANTLRALGVEKCYNYGLIAAAYQAAIQACGGLDRVVVFGSFVTVASCWHELQQI